MVTDEACRRFDGLIARSAQLTADEAAELEAHLASCVSCRELARAFAPASGPVREWLRGLHHVRDVGAVYRDEEGIRAVTSLQGRFDAIVFHDRVTAARPNPTAMRGAGSR